MTVLRRLGLPLLVAALVVALALVVGRRRAEQPPSDQAVKLAAALCSLRSDSIAGEPVYERFLRDLHDPLHAYSDGVTDPGVAEQLRSASSRLETALDGHDEDLLGAIDAQVEALRAAAGETANGPPLCGSR